MQCPFEIAKVITEMIQVGLLRIRAFGWRGDAAHCAIEADHIHNLPALLRDFSEDALRYYWDVERAAYLRHGPASAFEPLWQRLESAECLQVLSATSD